MMYNILLVMFHFEPSNHLAHLYRNSVTTAMIVKRTRLDDLFILKETRIKIGSNLGLKKLPCLLILFVLVECFIEPFVQNVFQLIMFCVTGDSDTNFNQENDNQQNRKL